MSKNNCKTQYNMWNIDKYNMLDSVHKNILLQEVNQQLKYLSAEDRVAWGLKYLPNQIVLSSSFGLQSVVILHLVTRQYCDIPIILIDTGYLFPETYRYIDQLTEDMKLNLQVFSALKSAAWQEVRYGQLWKQGIQGINKYNYINKVEPMQRAFKICKVSTWFSGLRRSQSSTRKKLQILSVQWGVFKLLPIIDWDDDQVCKYIEMYSLTLHPLWNQGYVSLGDVHTTAKYKVGINKEDTRFFGLKRECGLHEENF